MEKKNIILRVRDLRISFRTISGKVQAVRDVSFNLEKGKTLAIVGESGSGKSVTTRAVMGILAKNAIVESGEILYDGKDVLKLSEWELHKIRGEKISMIFQDPLSSLNPIIKIGKQLTEASVLKARSNRHENKAAYKMMITAISEAIDASMDDKEKEHALLSTYQEAAKKAVQEELEYSYAHSFLKDTKNNLEELKFALDYHLDNDLTLTFLELAKLLKKTINPYLINDKKFIHSQVQAILKKSYPLYLLRKVRKGKKDEFASLAGNVNELISLVDAALAKVKPDFFGYALSGDVDTSKSIEERNASVKEKHDSFVAEFSKLLDNAIAYYNAKSEKASAEAASFLENSLETFKKDELNKKELLASWKEMSSFVSNTINPIATNKDSYSLTFKDSLKKAILTYFSTGKTNEKEKRRFEKEVAKWNALKEKGKEPSFKPVPANVVEEERLRDNMTGIISNLISIYHQRNESCKANDEAASLYGELNKTALGTKKKHTKFMAKMVAIRLMKEVGIPEPRKRFKQYPFEFSGGMRQRIVIAIALTSNPEILICDEPTTALDVTIQAQILELINKIKEERHLSVIFITHNLGVVANMADKIAVMYAGKIVEFGTSNDIFYDPKHPYTWALLGSMPDLDTKEKLDAIPGTPPNMIYPPVGDAFAARNKYALKIDFRKEPPLYMVTPTHFARSWLLADDAPTVYPPQIALERIVRMEEKYGQDIDKELNDELNEEPDEAFASSSVKASDKKSMRLDAKAILSNMKKGDEKDGK